MLEEMDAIDSKVSRDEDMVFVVLRRVMTPSGSELSIQATSQDLELANELALKHFRDAHSQVAVPESESVEDSGEKTRPEGLEWALAKTGFITVGVGFPEAERHIKVWVDANVLSWKH